MSTMSCYAGNAITPHPGCHYQRGAFPPGYGRTVSEVAKEIHYYFDIDDISIVYAATVKTNSTSTPLTILINKSRPRTERSR